MHKLHDKQLEMLFMACFIKADHFTDTSPKAMAKMVIKDKLLPPTEMQTQSVPRLLQTFLVQVSNAYVTTGLYLQQKLPLESPVLRSLSALDPALRGHSQAGINMVPCLATFREGDDMVDWWAHVFESSKYPALCKVVKGALSIFHGPLVESSFNSMGDIINPKSTNMSIPTFNAIQTVKYTLKASNKMAVEM